MMKMIHDIDAEQEIFADASLLFIMRLPPLFVTAAVFPCLAPLSRWHTYNAPH